MTSKSKSLPLPDDWLPEDFDSRGFKPQGPSDHSYLKGMWGGFRATAADIAEDTIQAHGMVQSFVNAFARDGRYVVVFDTDVSTAGTDMNDRFVAITPSPIADKNLTAEEAGLVLTGLAVHEISHPRYGRKTFDAVEATFYGNRTAKRLSNLLDDIRIEQRFVEDYPGYAGIFKPTLDYIGGRGTNGGTKLHKQSLAAPVNLAIGATRYPEFSDWSDPVITAEGEWWKAWADRWAHEDAPARHVAAIREALAHIVNIKHNPPVTPPQSPPQGGQGSPSSGSPSDSQDGGDGEASDDADDTQSTQADGDGESDASPDDQEDSSQSGPGDEMNDRDLNSETRYDRENDPESSCSGSSAVDAAAVEGDTSAREIAALKSEAQDIIEAARNIEDDGHGYKVDVNRSLRGINNGRHVTSGSESTARQIRNAIIQSRTGHTAVESYRRTGRLDQKGLTRIAHGDYRTFEKRTAPSVGKFVIWVMVDCSMSMDGNPLNEATRVAHSLAAATNALPSVRMAIWGWTNAFRGNDATAGVAKAWETGWPLDEVFKLSSLNTGGTPDAVVMAWTGRAIKKEARADETPVIVFISDGEGMGQMDKRVQEVQESGVKVISVSFGSAFGLAAQEKRFGRGNCVPWQGSIEKTAKPLANMLIKIVTRQGGKK